MRRTFTVDPTGRDERVFVSRGGVPSAIFTLKAVIYGAACRGGLDQRTYGRLRHTSQES